MLRKEWKLKNFELKRIAVTGGQVRELKLFKAKDPKTLEKLYRDTRHKEFIRLNNGELFQTEADAILKATGLREIKRIIEQDIINKYWDKKKWKRYENIFTVGKVQLRFVKAMGELTTEILGDSEIEDSIDNALEKMSLGYESDELIQIEGDSYKEPIDEESGMYAVNEDDVGDDEDDELE